MDVSVLSHVDLSRAMNAARAAGHPCVAIVPAGACEQHGPFLPLGCDTAIARAVAERVDALATTEGTFAAFLFPGIDYTPCGTGASYPGNVSVPHPVFRSLVRAVLSDLLRQGFDAVAVLNGHGINTPSLLEEAHEILDAQFRGGQTPRRPILVIDTYAAQPLFAQRFGRPPGYHADWMELLMAMAVWGPARFHETWCDAYREWASRPAPTPPSTRTIVGVPIELRSREGVRGDPLPPQDDWWKLATEAMEFVSRQSYEALRDDLATFLKRFAAPTGG